MAREQAPEGGRVTPPTRPTLRYLGGKWLLAPWILEHFPAHRTYVEPFGGAASVLLRKSRSHAEVYNDLDCDLVNLFQVLRDDAMAERLVRMVALTPFSRAEFMATYAPSDDPVERARRLVARSFMGHGSNAANIERSTGFRADSTRNGTTPAVDWMNLPPGLALVAQRLRGVVIEQRPALEVMRRFDRPDTLVYVDPPYVHDTRSAKKVRGALYNAYRHELSDEQQVELLEALDGLKSMVVLSGYPHPLYDERLAHWKRVTREAMADGARVRTEVLWINPAAAARAADLFGTAA
ncbi:DNA adenine methylase [Caulobacter sp. CCNWLY153]|uniref:DNA adenine methylase n=1 Tax=unclassified Caulobacter TaxID=2648921 RepID=UPI002FF3C376